MSKNHPPSPAASPPPLPGGHATPQHAQLNNQRPTPPARTPKKRNSLAGLWVLLLLIGGIGGAGCLYWQYELAKLRLFGFQPPEMAMARYTPKDVIGDLGGLKVRILRHYAEYVEYDGDPGWGKKRERPIPERTFESRLSSFGISVRFPDMKGLENAELREELRNYQLDPNNPWIRIGINAGEIYPGLGANARNGLAKGIDEYSEYWWENYERLPEDIYGLEAYVVSGLHPATGLPAKEHDDAYDVYLHRESSGHVNTYIKCGKTSVPGGIASCRMSFSLEPDAEVAVRVSFYPRLLPRWKEIQQSSRDLLLSFEVQETRSQTP